MQKTIEKIAGDTDGVSFEFAVYRIKGTIAAARLPPICRRRCMAASCRASSPSTR